MRLRVIDDEHRIAKHQGTLAGRLRKAGEYRRGIWGYQSGIGGDKMYWFRDGRFWWDYRKLMECSTPKHWNAFGLTEPTGDMATPSVVSHSIVCEINIPLSGGTWRVAGVFVEDDDGEVYVAHSGRIGGGRRGIGTEAFVEHFAYPQQWGHVERNGMPKDVVMVSALDDDLLVQNLAHFIREVHRIKGIAGPGEPAPSPPNGYRREFDGRRRPYSVKTKIRSSVEHGKIVHGVCNMAIGMGLEVWNNQQTDLLVRRKRAALVEVKTGDIPYDRYAAIGQLLYHTKSDNDVLVAVFPSINPAFRNVLKRLGIVGATWRSAGNTYRFGPELRSVMKQL